MTPIPNFAVKDWKLGPDTTTPISAAALEDLEQRLADYARLVGENAMYDLVTDLPAAPDDGDAISLLVTGNLYPARYVTSADEWVVEHPLGNAPLYAAEANIAQDIMTAAWAAHGGPTLPLPRAMDVLVRARASVAMAGSNDYAEWGVAVDAEAAPSSPIGSIGVNSGSGSSESGLGDVLTERTGLASGAVIRHLSRGIGQKIVGRTLEVHPTRFPGV